MSAPSSRHTSSFSSDPAVVATRAPSARASWIAKVPMPPAPPCTSSVSSGCSPATMNTLDQTVQATSGSAAAVDEVDALGHGHHLPGRHSTFSAYPPPASRAQTSSPTCQRSTPSPTAATVPLHSSPMTSLAPGGGG